ncbi:hypothetical protein [Streptosporangium sp. V21-05]|uniref:hypothetical protein n=1 Tax=Streptosporangium sp. V21-05 TaxID=3446115 RepID=UPI003F533909
MHRNTESPHAPGVGDPPPLTGGQADALATSIGHAFPPWRIWWANDIWYATGPCPVPGCVCTPTLHDPAPSGLCRQLDEHEWRAGARREDPR